jgi:hypothetical protein
MEEYRGGSSYINRYLCVETTFSNSDQAIQLESRDHPFPLQLSEVLGY